MSLQSDSTSAAAIIRSDADFLTIIASIEAIDAVYRSDLMQSDAATRLIEAQDPLIEAASQYRPTTQPGIAAMARLVAAHGTFKCDLSDPDGLWLLSALFDCLGASGAFVQAQAEYHVRVSA